MKKQLTVDDIMEWVMCKEWSREKVQEKFGKRKTVTPLQLAGAEGVSAQDKLWILLRPEIIPKKELQFLACDFAEDVLPIFEKEYPDDKRLRQAIEAKRKWARGEISDEQMVEARNAARVAAWTASTTSAVDVVVGAAWVAARAARDATWTVIDAAWTAANVAGVTWDSARNVWIDEQGARDAAWNRYLKMTIKVLGE